MKIAIIGASGFVGKCMLGSFRNEMIVTNNKARDLFPNINPRKIEEFFI